MPSLASICIICVSMVYVVNILLYKEYCIILLGLPKTAKSLVQRLKILNHTRMITVTVIPEGPQQTNNAPRGPTGGSARYLPFLSSEALKPKVQSL